MRIPPSFYMSIGRFLLFIALEVICLVLIFNDGIVQQYQILEQIRNVQTFFWKKSNNIKVYSNLSSINKELAEQNLTLLKENEKYRTHLEKIYGGNLSDSIAANTDSSAQIFLYDWAKVIKNTLNTTHNYIIINKGRKDGIKEDMGVITPWGAIGIVRAVGKNHAFVLSFLNPKQQVSAKIGHTNTFGPLSWDGISIDHATLNEIPQHVPIHEGDTIYTSGYSSFYPPDIPIGIAGSSKIVNGMHRAINVKLLQDFRILDYVIVVKNTNFAEIDSLSKFPPAHE